MGDGPVKFRLLRVRLPVMVGRLSTGIYVRFTFPNELVASTKSLRGWPFGVETERVKL